MALEFLNRFQEAAFRVLCLLRFDQALFDWRLNSQKYAVETRLPHLHQQRIVVRKVDAGFRKERKRKIMFLLPGEEIGKELPDIFLIPDKVIVDDEHGSAPVETVQGVKF